MPIATLLHMGLRPIPRAAPRGLEDSTLAPASTRPRLSRASRVLASTLVACVTGCADPGATITVTDARISRDAAKNVVVDIDLLGKEGLGGSIGVYCTRVVFVDPTDIRDECKSDIEDGDTKTVRFVGGNLPAGTVIKVRVRLNATDERRDVVAPK